MVAAAVRVIRSISVLRLGTGELDLWAAAYAADPHWRRIWKRFKTRATADQGSVPSPAEVENEDIEEGEEGDAEIVANDDASSVHLDTEPTSPPKEVKEPTASPRHTAEQVATRFLNHVYPISGLPKAIISDRDTRFTDNPARRSRRQRHLRSPRRCAGSNGDCA
ncbi:unnamed protein product [Tilletia laevis]|uniref:Uncharacterized protein n=1 Tax=Tilletia laevis TaxID=157183 RepID=A0A9N8LVZ7_9BASI|nr:unnamed protein product [Tilletia laevis]